MPCQVRLQPRGGLIKTLAHVSRLRMIQPHASRPRMSSRRLLVPARALDTKKKAPEEAETEIPLILDELSLKSSKQVRAGG